jgi:hypothetical protein
MKIWSHAQENAGGFVIFDDDLGTSTNACQQCRKSRAASASEMWMGSILKIIAFSASPAVMSGEAGPLMVLDWQPAPYLNTEEPPRPIRASKMY